MPMAGLLHEMFGVACAQQRVLTCVKSVNSGLAIFHWTLLIVSLTRRTARGLYC